MTDKPSEATTPADRYLRGALGMGVAWAAGGAIVAPLSDVFDVVFLGGASWYIPGAVLIGTFFGFIGGGVFSVALAVAGRRRRFDEMSLPRFAALGALVPSLILVGLAAFSGEVGSLFRWLLTPSGLANTTFLVLAGAGFSAGSLALARKADDGELLQADADVAEIGLSKEEKRQLLGR